MVVAMCRGGHLNVNRGEARPMKEIADNFVKLLALIMTMITLAVSTAAFSMMFG